MIPDYIPVFEKVDMLPPGSHEYRIGERATIVGWLKELFLYGPSNTEYMQITPEDRKDYNGAVAAFKRVNNINKSVELDDYEDDPSNGEAKQAAALNALRIELGYVVMEKNNE